jgi:hypothetical protein
MSYKKGDIVKVWSLQSFSGGGFLNGEKAIVRQNQTGDSVIICVVRMIDGEYKVDTAYEVYSKQIELYDKSKETSYNIAMEKLDNIKKILTNNKLISDEYGYEEYL